jgi:thiamine kinase-like enzyme
MKLTPLEVLAGIPGWGGATVERLTGGLTNTTYHVSKGGKAGVLKLDEAKREAPFNSRLAEAQIQKTAAEAGLAPPVILADDCIYFSEYLQGRVWERSSLDDEGLLELLASTLRRLHRLPLTGRTFDAKVAARHYVEQTNGLSTETIALCMKIIKSMRLPQNFCCCHNDLVAENIITTPYLMFLDWEYACDNDPFFDLATIVEHHELGDEQVTRLLNAYFDGNGQRWRSNLEKQRKLYLALLCLWMASRPDSDETELLQVVARLTTSCS